MKKMVFFLIVTLYYSASCFAGKRFTFVTVNFPPYYSENLPEKGWVSEIVKKALEIQGYRVDIEFMAWEEALENTREGYNDGLLGAYHTRERAQQYYFSAPIAQARIGFFKRKDVNISFQEVTELKGYKIGMIKGYATSKSFDSADYLNKIEVNNLNEGLIKLFNKEIDLMADSQAVGKYQLKLLEKRYPGISQKIKFIKPVLAINKLYVAISKKTTNAYRKLMDFNKGLRKLYMKGSFRRIKKKHKKYIQ
jgi:polar amino acid transport system substrate-binding protein